MQKTNYSKMIETPVKQLIPRLAVPTIISMLTTSIYNMADTFFVSKINTSATGAVGVLFSAMAMIQAIGFMLGMGSGNYISRSLGTQKIDEAEKAASTAFFTALGIGVIILIFGSCFTSQIVTVLGATPTILPYAIDYARYIFFAAPFMISAFVLNNILRSQGNAIYAMVGITTGGILNMILDPILIFKFNMGISGAAIATMVSQIISAVILFTQCMIRENCLKIKPKKFTPTAKIYGTILHAGLPSLCRQGLAAVATTILNVAAGPYGDAAIAAMSICSRFMMFVNSALIGFGQGFQPVCGFNFGAGRYDRVLEAFWFCVKVAVVLLTTLGIISIIFSNQIIVSFQKDDAEVIKIGLLALRLQLCTLPIQAWIIMVNMLTQSIGYGFRASIVAMGRQGLFFIPAVLILPKFMDILGIQLSQPISDVFTFILSLVIVIPILKELKDKNIAMKRELNN